MTRNIIQVNQLSKTYVSGSRIFTRKKKEVNAVTEVSFSVGEGELVGFLGPNGAGKTTTLKMLSGILHPTGGTAEVLGYTPWKRNRAYQKQFSLVMGQKNQLWWDLPVKDSFALNKAIYEIETERFNSVVRELGSLLQVEHVFETQVRKLSLGERMKCELISALLHTPKVLFLDEPTIGLDVVSQHTVREFIKEYNKRYNTTILLTSHYMDDVEALCERVVIIDHGVVLFDGLLQDLIEQYTGTKILTLRFSSPVRQSDLNRYGSIQERSALHAVIEVPKKKHLVIAAGMLQKLPIEDMSIEEVPIERVISTIFSKKKA